jgi:hypothetical protein
MEPEVIDTINSKLPSKAMRTIRDDDDDDDDDDDASV